MIVTSLYLVGRQVWFELTDWDFNKRQSIEENTISESDLYLFLSNKGKLYPLLDSSILTDGVYLSYAEHMKIHLRTGDAPNGKGFKGLYKTSEKNMLSFSTRDCLAPKNSLDARTLLFFSSVFIFVTHTLLNTRQGR